MTSPHATALAELGAVLDGIDQSTVDKACAMIAGAGTILLYGCGREGLQLRGLAMRLHHLGLNVAMVGDMAALPLGPGDVFITSAGPGEIASVTALMEVARRDGAKTLFLTAVQDAPAAKLADLVLTIPAQTMANDQGAGAKSVLPMGSLYEGALFMLFEMMVLDLCQRLDVTPEAMRTRHTNME